MGTRVDLMNENPERAEGLGPVAIVNLREVEDPAAEVRVMTDGGADVSTDALGNPVCTGFGI